MFNINGTYTIVVENGKITSVKCDGKKEMKKMNEYKHEKLHRKLNLPVEMKPLPEDVTLPNGISGCITLGSVIDDPTAKCDMNWGTWW